MRFLKNLFYKIIFIIELIKDIFLSTISLVKLVLHYILKNKNLEPAIIKINRLDMTDQQSIALGGYITLTPGTYTMKITSSTIFVNVLDGVNFQAAIEDITKIKAKIMALK